MRKLVCFCLLACLGMVTAGAVEIYGVYNVDANRNKLVKFDSNNVGGLTAVGDMTGMTGFTGSLEFVGADLFAYLQVAPYGLYKIDQTTGAATLRGTGGLDPGYGINDLALNPRDGKLYGIATLTTAGTPQLYTVDPASGVATKVGVINGMAGTLPVGLAADKDGTMYVLDLVFDKGYTLPFGSLNATGLPQGIGFAANYGQGWNIDWAGDGVLHYAAFNTAPLQGEYRRVDKSTGASTLIGPFPIVPGTTYGQISDLAIVPEPATLALLGLAVLSLRRR